MKVHAAVMTCLLLVTAWPRTCRGAEAAGARPRVFWEAALGPVYSDNVYRDRSDEADAGYDVRLRGGVRYRPSAKTFTELHYDLDALTFASASVENRAEHAFEGLLRRRVREALTVEMRAGLRLSRYPNVPTFDSTTVFGRAAAKSYLDPRTTLEGGGSYEKKSFPEYDLDYGGVGLQATLARDLGRRTFGELSASFRNEDYSERGLDPSRAVQPGEDLRVDRDWLVGARVVRDLSLVLQLQGSYQYGRLSSNGASLDFGPFQSQLTDVPGDDRLLNNYYTHRRHELSAHVRKLIRRGSSVFLGARYQDRVYPGRLAKDENDQFRSPEQLRHDHGLLLWSRLDVPFPVLPRRAAFGHFGLRLRLSHEINASNEALYDYGNTVVAFSLTSWF